MQGGGDSVADFVDLYFTVTVRTKQLQIAQGIVALRRQRSRLGAPKAITATAHKLARIVYHVLRYGEAYAAQQEEQFAEEVRERQEKNLHRRAKEMGYEVKKIDAPPSEETPAE